jgi:hypothetical protein
MAQSPVARLSNAPVLADARDIEDDRGVGGTASNRSQCAIGSRNASKVDGKIIRSTQDSGPVCSIEKKIDGGAARSKKIASVARLKGNGRLAILRQRSGTCGAHSQREKAQKSLEEHPHDDRPRMTIGCRGTSTLEPAWAIQDI